MDFEIDHYFRDKTIFEKQEVKITAYEVNEKNEERINETLVAEKYFDFNSITIPPSEITKEQYLQ